MLSVLNSQAFQKKQHVLTKNSLMTNITFLKVTKREAMQAIIKINPWP